MRTGLPPRREYALCLGLGAAGGALVLLSARQAWAHVVTPASAPLPASSVAVSGQSLVPLAGALGVAALASLVAVIATRGLARRVVGGVLVAAGVAIVAAVSLRLGAAQVLSAAHGATASPAGSVTGNGGAGVPAAGVPGVTTAGQVVMAGFPWRALAGLGGLAVTGAGLAVTWWGARWPVMSSRYQRAGGQAGERPDSAGLWESLSAGKDPTEGGWPDGAASGRPHTH